GGGGGGGGGGEGREWGGDAELGAAEKISSNLTTALAALAAQRSRFQNTAREKNERIARISPEIEAIERELATLPTADSSPLVAILEGAQAALTEAEAAAVAAEAAHNMARAEMDTESATITQ